MPSPRAAQLQQRTNNRRPNFVIRPLTVDPESTTRGAKPCHENCGQHARARDPLKSASGSNTNKDHSFSLKAMLQWFADMFCTSESASKRPTMASDPVLQLVDHSLTYDTNTYLDKLISLAIVSSDYEAILNRFVVISVTLTKTRSSPQHEFLVLMLMDTKYNGSAPYLMFLERTKLEKRHNPIRSFLNHPDNATVIASIIDTLKELPSSLLSSVPSTSDSEDESSPGADSSDSPRNISPSDPLLSTSSPSPSNPNLLRNLIDSGTLVSAKAIHMSTESTGKLDFAYAQDQFTGGNNVRDSGSVLGQIVWQIQPKALSLFQVVVLADVVHNYAPLYSLFKRQCYWFAFIICAVILKTCTCSSIGSPGLHAEDDICIPPNSYLPNLAGRWMGILVRGVEEAVLKIMIEKYEARCDEKLDEVRCVFYSEQQLINFEYSWRWHGVASADERLHCKKKMLDSEISSLTIWTLI